MDSRFHFFTRSLAVVLGMGLVVGLGVRSVQAGPEDLKGKPAPDFKLATANDKQVALSELKGKVVVVDFWATWCPPCRKSLPHVQKLSEDQSRFKEGLRVLAVNAREPKAKIEPFMQENKYTFAVPMDSTGKTMGAYQVSGIPTTVVIGRDGVVRDVFVGFHDDGGKSLDEAVDAALKEKSAK
jgi:cytochrome c biogenesis protein CcmG/thiol:disulfide interchange protein DsbE